MFENLTTISEATTLWLDRNVYVIIFIIIKSQFLGRCTVKLNMLITFGSNQG